MPGPESSPGLPPKTDTTEKRKKGKEKFAIIRTHLSGISLRAEPGVEPDMRKKDIEYLYDLARGYAGRYFQAIKLESQQEEPHQEIEELAKTTEGLRGIQSEPDNFKINVIPRDTVTYVRLPLREALGLAYPSVVHEEMRVSIAIPVGFPTEKGPIEEELLRQVLTQALLVELGLPEVELKKIMEMQIIPRVDEKKLGEMTAKGQISIPEETKQIKRTWAISVDRLREPQAESQES